MEQNPLLIICRSEGKYFLLMSTPTEQNPVAAVRAFRNKQEVMDNFKGYTQGWTGQGYERYASCTIGMMNMQPVAINGPDDPGFLQKYIVDMKLYHIRGGVLGRGYHGIQVSEEILKLQVFDIWKESMILAGIA